MWPGFDSDLGPYICGSSLLLVLSLLWEVFLRELWLSPLLNNQQKFQFDRMQDLPENHFGVSGASWVNIINYYTNCKFSCIPSGQIFIRAWRLAKVDPKIWKIPQCTRTWRTKRREQSKHFDLRSGLPIRWYPMLLRTYTWTRKGLRTSEREIRKLLHCEKKKILSLSERNSIQGSSSGRTGG